MNSHSLIDAAKDALEASIFPQEYNNKFSYEAIGIALLGVTLLEDLEAKNIPDSKKNEEINIIAIGAIVAAVAYQSMQWGESEDYSHMYLSNDPASAYYKKSYSLYFKDWNTLKAINVINTEQLRSQYDESTFNTMGRENPLLVLMILETGTKIMNGQLLIDCEALKAGFPHLKTQFDAIPKLAQENVEAKSAEKKVDYSSITLAQFKQAGSIAKIFKEAIEAACPSQDKTSDKQKFARAVEDLQRQVLTNFRNGDPLFNASQCMLIARHTTILARKVGQGMVTDRNCETFDYNTKKYRSNKGVAIVLAAILGIVVGMIAGTAVGFAVGGIPGAIGGSAAGLVTGGVLGASAAFWQARKQDPVIQVSQAAKAVMRIASPAKSTGSQ